MKRKWNFACIFASALLLLFLAGCSFDASLPENPIKFHTGTFTNPNHAENQYQSIEYNGRTYILYDGNQKGSLTKEVVGPCLGYIVQDGDEDPNDRVYLLKEDPDANYLMEYYVGGEMMPTFFLRATDTVGQDIPTPSCIEPYTAEYYNECHKEIPSFVSYWE